MTLSTAPGTARPFDAVLCDVDNVIRFYDSSRLAELERAAGLPEGATAAVAFRPDQGDPLVLGQVTKEQWAESVADRLGAEAPLPGQRARELADALALSPFEADEAVVRALRGVREAGLSLVLVTNAALDLDEDLAAMGLEDLADHVVNSALEGVAKPDPEIYAIAAGRAGAAPERCLFVDDRRENVEAAVALGMTGVHFRGPEDLRGALAFLG
ncbi:putative hydrolase of the HAD superfamily [Streptomyces sp. Ag109_G2-6]|uniref:HAD-IA family hydrolase n=1 Tax=Streptomyces TaxID=1883 RepID=UPI0009A49329|nr:MULTISPECIES: HAD-IA family hydrolase [Streptomyces]RPF40328.1 putative hydrolase of the HAD superfamily [Streptomyces sp. Ag109_G2-6]